MKGVAPTGFWLIADQTFPASDRVPFWMRAFCRHAAPGPPRRLSIPILAGGGLTARGANQWPVFNYKGVLNFGDFFTGNKRGNSGAQRLFRLRACFESTQIRKFVVSGIWLQGTVDAPLLRFHCVSKIPAILAQYRAILSIVPDKSCRGIQKSPSKHHSCSLIETAL